MLSAHRMPQLQRNIMNVVYVHVWKSNKNKHINSTLLNPNHSLLAETNAQEKPLSMRHCWVSECSVLEYTIINLVFFVWFEFCPWWSWLPFSKEIYTKTKPKKNNPFWKGFLRSFPNKKPFKQASSQPVAQWHWTMMVAAQSADVVVVFNSTAQVWLIKRMHIQI